MTDRYEWFHGTVGRTVPESTSWWSDPVRPPAGAPNIVLVLLDDLGYSDIGPFGSEIATPNVDALAANGLRLSNYHTAPLCSPARAALLTGLNPHRAGFGGVANLDPGFPGYTMEIADDVPTLAEALREAGYATFAVGKWHLTRDSLMHDGAAKSSWPCQRGFDRFYGVLEGLTNLHHPHRLIVDNSPVEIDQYRDDYYLTDDITDQAIKLIQGLRASDARRPFFCYVAHPAVHGPLQAKAEDIDRYRGRYDIGWDEVREDRFARQVGGRLFPPGTTMAPRNHETNLDVLPWSELSMESQRLFARYQEVYAAMVDNVDQNLGRLLAVIGSLGELDDTIVIFTSDNGATSEGGAIGTRSYLKQFNFHPHVRQHWDLDVLRDPDLIGGPQALVHYPRGWGMASNTPFRLYKRHTHAGGVRVPFVLSWSRLAEKAKGRVRTEYQYVTDLMPTLLDIAGVARPSRRGDRDVVSLDGTSFVEALRDPDLPTTHTEQYSECVGNRSFFKDGWKLVSVHHPAADYNDSEWELYDIREDPTEARDLSGHEPERVRALAADWELAAWDNTVFPLIDAKGYFMNVRRPSEHELEEPVTLLPGTPTLERYRSSRLIAYRAFRIDIEMAYDPGDEGTLVAHGDQGGGYALYVIAGQVRFTYNEYGVMREVDGARLRTGRQLLTVEATAVEGLRWNFRLLIDDQEVAQLPGCLMLLFMAPLEGIDIGIDRRSPVSWPVYEEHGPFPYGGAIHSVTYTPGRRAPYDPQMVLRLGNGAADAFE